MEICYSRDNVSIERIYPEGIDSDRWSSVTRCKKEAILTFQKAGDQGCTIQKSGFKLFSISIIITHKIIKYKWQTQIHNFHMQILPCEQM